MNLAVWLPALFVLGTGAVGVVLTYGRLMRRARLPRYPTD